MQSSSRVANVFFALVLLHSVNGEVFRRTQTDDRGIPRVYLAKIAKEAEDYESMVRLMKKVVENMKGTSLTNEERDLFALAYKKVTSQALSAWRVVSGIEQKIEKGDSKQELVEEYREELGEKIKDICTDILSMLDKYLIPKETMPENKVVYLTLKGDYHRYLAEINIGDNRKEAIENAESVYKEAYGIAKKELAPTHPIRLTLALNMAVFYYELLNDPNKACTIAKEAFDVAIAELDTLNEDSYKDSTLIMQLLRDNLTLWTSDQDNGESDTEQDKRDYRQVSDPWW